MQCESFGRIKNERNSPFCQSSTMRPERIIPGDLIGLGPIQTTSIVVRVVLVALHIINRRERRKDTRKVDVENDAGHKDLDGELHGVTVGQIK